MAAADGRAPNVASNHAHRGITMRLANARYSCISGRPRASKMIGRLMSGGVLAAVAGEPVLATVWTVDRPGGVALIMRSCAGARGGRDDRRREDSNGRLLLFAKRFEFSN
jgi:hypothetical protein